MDNQLNINNKQMKKLNKLFSLFAAMIVAIGFCGCDDEVKAPVENIVPPSYEADAKVANPSTMEFTMTLNGVQQIAYEVQEGHVAKSRGTAEENERGALIFKNATEIFDAVNGENKITVTGLEGNKDYTISFAFKTGESVYTVKDEEVTTPGYEKIITVLDVTTDGFRVHVELPDTMWWRWGYAEAASYHEMEQFGASDIDRLEYNGGQFLKGAQTLDIKNGGLWYNIENDIYDENWNVIGTEEEPVYHMIFPGYSYIFMLAECNSEGQMNYTTSWGDGDDDYILGSKLPNVLDYTEEWVNDFITFEGKYARVQFDIDAPALQESQLQITPITQNERRATFEIVPSTETRQYAVTLFTDEQYELLKGWVGENALKWVALNYSMVYTDAQQIEITELNASNYKMLVYGSYSDDSMLMSYEEFDVKSTPSDKPVANLVVTAATKEEIEALGHNPAYMVGFKVQCPEGNCAGVRYVMNYTSEWEDLLNWGMTDADILAAYGNDIFKADDEEFINAINSADGYIMTFTTNEATESTLAIAGFNEDEKMSDAVVAKAASTEEMGVPFESELFTALEGDWTATYSYNDMNGNSQNSSFKVTISNGPDMGPEQMDADIEAALVQYFMKVNRLSEEDAKKKVEDNFNDYKAKAQKFQTKWRSLNRMILNGFEPLHEYKSAWDLSIDLDYSAADTEDLFYDYGPKMFLQLTQLDGTNKVAATLNSRLDQYPPVAAWKDYYDYYLTGFAAGAESFMPSVEFPVEISEDNQTITIKTLDAEGNTMYPSIAYPSYGAAYGWQYGGSFVTTGTSEIVLKKGWDGEDVAPTRGVKASGKKITAHRNGNRFMKTNLPNSKDAVVMMQKTTINANAAGEKLMKDMKRHQQMIEKLKK